MATDIRLFILAGQSNADGQGVVGCPAVDVGVSLDYNGVLLQDYSLITDKSMYNSFANGLAELSTDKYCRVKKTEGGSFLLPQIPTQPTKEWSPAGNLRGELVDLVNDTLSMFSLNSLYNVVGIDMLWMQGEQDVGQPTSDYRDALVVLHDYFVAEFNLDNMYITELGEAKDGSQSGGWADIRQAQTDASVLRPKIQVYYDRAKDFTELGWMLDNVHYNQLGQNDIGFNLAEYISGESINIYRDTIYTEVIDIDNATTYQRWNGDAVNEVEKETLYNLIGSPTFEAGTLVDRQDQLVTAETAYVESVDNPIKHPCWSVSSWVWIPSDWNGGTCAIWGDEALMASVTTSSGHSMRLGFNFGLNGLNGADSYQYYSAVSTTAYKGRWIHVVETSNDTEIKLYVDNVLLISETPSFSVRKSHDPFRWGVGNTYNGGVELAPNKGVELAKSRIHNHALTVAEIDGLFNEIDPYNLINTPATPDAPVIPEGGEDNDTNTITLTPATGLQVQLKAETTWTDAVSPYLVTYDTYTSYDPGDIRFRVAADGINPESAETPNTKEFTAATQIDRTPIFVYANDLNAPTENVVLKIRLVNESVQYKDSDMQSENLSFAPDTSGKISFSIPDTDSMVGDQYYVFDSGGGVRRKAQVPKQTEEINLFALPNIERF
ncbi:MAG: hypothetical protein DRH97_00090 [Chloroflexi bacterium]|nr:MAG: hypothetical protein DRH97_00090 [Chloroflexota bacterium]